MQLVGCNVRCGYYISCLWRLQFVPDRTEQNNNDHGVCRPLRALHAFAVASTSSIVIAARRRQITVNLDQRLYRAVIWRVIFRIETA